MLKRKQYNAKKELVTSYVLSRHGKESVTLLSIKHMYTLGSVHSLFPLAWKKTGYSNLSSQALMPKPFIALVLWPLSNLTMVHCQELGRVSRLRLHRS